MLTNLAILRQVIFGVSASGTLVKYFIERALSRRTPFLCSSEFQKTVMLQRTLNHVDTSNVVKVRAYRHLHLLLEWLAVPSVQIKMSF